jgi:hypothetical protein
VPELKAAGHPTGELRADRSVAERASRHAIAARLALPIGGSGDVAEVSTRLASDGRFTVTVTSPAYEDGVGVELAGDVAAGTVDHRGAASRHATPGESRLSEGSEPTT